VLILLFLLVLLLLLPPQLLLDLSPFAKGCRELDAAMRRLH